MIGLNWVDIVIILLLADAIYSGIRIGFLTLLMLFGGFFGSLFVIGLILPHLLPISDPTIKAVINGNLLILISLYIGFRGYKYGLYLHKSFGKGKAHLAESVSGIILSLSSAVIIIWLIAAAIVSLPFVGLSNSVDDAFFVQLFNRHLPAAPAVFERFSTLVNPNQLPEVYVKDIANSSIGSAPLPKVTEAVKTDGQSIVRITGFGCSGIIEGSGFSIGDDLIATNAHVIAGVKRPIVKYQSNSYVATPVLFDSDLDFAVLRINLKIPALKVNSSAVAKGTAIDTIGYPGGIFTISKGVIRGSMAVSSGNIYGFGSITRSTYALDSPVVDGLSGGPVVLPNGSVVGIVFARAQKNPSYGYALTSSSLLKDIRLGQESSNRVGSGACISP